MGQVRVWTEIGKPHYKLLLAGIICTFIAAGAEGYSITLVKKVIDQGFIEKNVESLYFFGLLIVGTFCFKSLFAYAKAVLMAKAGLLGATDLRRRMYRHMLLLNIGYFHWTPSGTIMNFFTGLTSAVMKLVTDRVISIVQNIATIGMMLGLMIWFAPQMTAIISIIIPFILVPLTIIMRKRRVLSRKGFNVDANSISHLSQTILGISTIQSFVAEEHENDKMNAIEDERVKVSLKSAKLSALQSPLLEIVISFGLCGALILGGHFIASGAMTTGDFTAFILALTAAYKPSKSLTTVGGGIQTGLIAADALFNFLDSQPAIANIPGATDINIKQMAVDFNNVTFSYWRQENKALKNVTFKVNPGCVCAFVGPSGAGKSTIFNLILRYYEPQHGTITINGINTRNYSLQSLRQNIASVSQNVFLFNGTIADNIRYGKPNATREEIEAAAKSANAHEFIINLPNGYDSYVGELGTLLSGGQKQRIAIARAILKDAPILLLDEATSALDSQSEKLIQSALKTLMHGRTTFVIAHRLATIFDADLICVVKDGQIVEQGTDKELDALGGEYKKLKKLQFKV